MEISISNEANGNCKDFIKKEIQNQLDFITLQKQYFLIVSV